MAFDSHASSVSSAAPAIDPATQSEASLRESLKRCSPATLEAALAYRQTKDPVHLPQVALGILERFLEPEAQTMLREGDNELRFMEDLGLDSLTIMEVVMMVEEVLEMPIANEELRFLRTVGDLKVFIDCKARGLPPPPPPKFLPIESIVSVLPQQHPFLFIQEATVSPTGATGSYRIAGDEFFLQGHFKDNPVFPASIMMEALGQLAVLFLLESGSLDRPVNPAAIFFTGSDGVRCSRICKPGDTLRLAIKLKKSRHPLAVFEGSIRVGKEKAAVAESITLTFDWLPDPPPPAAEPESAGAADSAEASEAEQSSDLRVANA
jgi:acyl carrier protein